MKVPDKVNILGYIYEVKVIDNFKEAIKDHIDKDENTDDFAGYFSTECNTIWIDNKATEQNKKSVFIHEVIEAINAHLALNIPHDNIDRLEAAIYQVLVSNNMLR